MAFLNTNIPELTGSDTAVCLGNLDILALRRNRVTESMLAMLSELADAILRDAGGDPDTVDSILLSLQDITEEGDPEPQLNADMLAAVAEVNRDLIGRATAHTGVHMRLILYRLIAERLSDAQEGTDAEETPEARPTPLPESVRGRIAYMASTFADKAYLRLASCVPRARAATFHSFVDACEEVRGGLCEYAILPLENTASGKLTAFSRLIIRYGLAIVAVCDLENGANAGQSTRFALLEKASEASAPRAGVPRPLGSAPLRLELLHTMSTPSVSDLLTAASFCGLALLRADTLPRFEELTLLAEEQGTDPSTPAVCCVFDTTGADLETFFRYLALDAPEDMIMGLYGAV